MDWLSALLGASSLFVGVPMAIVPARKRRIAIKKRDARLAELRAGFPERFFEERRSLEAYPPPNADWKARSAGATLTISGVLLLLLAA